MKILIFSIALLFSTLFVINAQTINGQWKTTEKNSSSYTINLQVNINQGSAVIGNSVIRFTYNPAAVSFPQNPKEETDYSLQNFNNSDYAVSVSNAAPGIISINIAKISGQGTTISTDFVDVATIHFHVVNNAEDPNIKPDVRQFFSPSSSIEWSLGNWDYVPVVTGTSDAAKSPKYFELKQNYPNPFNPVTTIKFQVPNRSLVVLKIYDITGKEVKTLINEEKESGSYQIQFNASALASGTYFYRLQSGSFVETKKMILLK